MRNYDVIYNKGEYLRDGRLSLKAKGLMAMVIRYINQERPDILILNDLREMCCDGMTAFNNAEKELERLGYITKRRGRCGLDKTPWVYTLKE